MTHLIDCNKSGFETFVNGSTTTLVFKPERGVVLPGDIFVFQEMGETKGIFTGKEHTMICKESISHYHHKGLKTGFYVVTVKEKELSH